jgi:hypothetical protein
MLLPMKQKKPLNVRQMAFQMIQSMLSLALLYMFVLLVIAAVFHSVEVGHDFFESFWWACTTATTVGHLSQDRTWPYIGHRADALRAVLYPAAYHGANGRNADRQQ